MDILNNGVDINLNREEGISFFYMVYENENDSNVKFLVNNGIDIDL